MSSCSIKVDTKSKVTIDEKEAIIVAPNEVAVKLNESHRVTVSPRSYHIVSQDVYTIRRNSELDPWFEDQLNNIIDTGNLADEVSDLENAFVNFEDGITMEIGYLKNADTELAYNLSIVKASNDNNTAGIYNLDTTKVTELEARAISSATIGAWQNDGSGGAWFNQQVTTVSNVAYSAAKSASTLTATMKSQQDQMLAIVGDIDALEKQVDGKVETFFYDTVNEGFGPVTSQLNIDVTKEPYTSWYVAGTVDDRAIHTGDTYVLTSLNHVTGNNDLVASYRFAHSATNPPHTDTDGFVWVLVTDDTATKALQDAANAQSTADGKIVTFWQSFPPTDLEASLGDLWLDSDDNNKLYRYNNNAVCTETGIVGWCPVDDKRVTASVDRLDEAMVLAPNKYWVDDGSGTDPDVNGNKKLVTRAKSSLSVNANGVASGYVAESDGSTSTFRIFADKFTITNDQNNSDAGAPFSVDTTTNRIKFNGVVEFSNVEGSDSLATKEDLAGTNGTVIDGGAIISNTINANKITAGTSLSSPLINGGKIVGGSIEGVTIEGAIIRSSYTDTSQSSYLTTWKYYTSVSSIPVGDRANFAHDVSGNLITDNNGYYRLVCTLPYYSTTFSNSTSAIDGASSSTSGTLDTHSYDTQTVFGKKVISKNFTASPFSTFTAVETRCDCTGKEYMAASYDSTTTILGHTFRFVGSANKPHHSDANLVSITAKCYHNGSLIIDIDGAVTVGGDSISKDLNISGMSVTVTSAAYTKMMYAPLSPYSMGKVVVNGIASHDTWSFKSGYTGSIFKHSASCSTSMYVHTGVSASSTASFPQLNFGQA